MRLDQGSETVDPNTELRPFQNVIQWRGRHRRASIAITIGAVTAVIAGLAFGGAAVAADFQRQGAVADFKASVATFEGARTRDTAARVELAAAVKAGTSATSELGKLMVAGDGILDPTALDDLRTATAQYIDALNAAEDTDIGGPSTTVPASTDEVERVTVKLRAAAAATQSHTRRLRTSTTRIASAGKSMQPKLTAVVATLPAGAQALIGANSSADAGAQAAVSAAQIAVSTALSKKGDLVAALLSYVAKAKALQVSQASAVAAQQAADEAAAQQAARSGAGSGGSSPSVRTSNAHSSDGGAPSSGGSSGGNPSGGAPSGGAPSSGGTVTPPVIDHTPRVTANGQYTAGCDGALVYTQSTSSGGGIIIDVGYQYTYSTYSTADGWGLKVFACI